MSHSHLCECILYHILRSVAATTVAATTVASAAATITPAAAAATAVVATAPTEANPERRLSCPDAQCSAETNRLEVGIVRRLTPVLPLGRRGWSLGAAHRRSGVRRGSRGESHGGRVSHGRVCLLRWVARLLGDTVGGRGLGWV